MFRYSPQVPEPPVWASRGREAILVDHTGFSFQDTWRVRRESTTTAHVEFDRCNPRPYPTERLTTEYEKTPRHCECSEGRDRRGNADQLDSQGHGEPPLKMEGDPDAPSASLKCSISFW